MVGTLITAADPAVSPALVADFHRSHATDLPSYLIGDNLGGLIAMLVILPAWSLLLGLVGGQFGRLLNRDPVPLPQN